MCKWYGMLSVCSGDGKKVMLDVEGKKPDRILSEIEAVAGKTE